jgi:hypothetical protein
MVMLMIQLQPSDNPGHPRPSFMQHKKAADQVKEMVTNHSMDARLYRRPHCILHHILTGSLISVFFLASLVAVHESMSGTG